MYAGKACSEEEWSALIDRFANGAAGAPFLVQRYVTPYRTKTIPPATDLEWLVEQGLATSVEEVEREGVLYNNISGLYLYNGTFTGVFSRLGPLPEISKEHHGMTAATIRVHDRA